MSPLPEVSVDVLQGAMTFVPVLFTVVLLLSIRPSARFLTGLGLATVWNVTLLLPVNLIAIHRSWWSFHDTSAKLFSLPVDLMFGWGLLWGATFFLVFEGRYFVAALAAATIFDLIVMPLCTPVIILGEGWLWGELLALCVCFAPGWWLALATIRDKHVGWRASLHVVVAGLLLLWILPSYLLSLSGKQLSDIVNGPAWMKSALGNGFFLASLLGIAATQEFVCRGDGTAFPFDPPKRFVYTGPYAYIANPMQTCALMALLLFSLAFKDLYLLGAAGVAVAFSGGIARWHHLSTATARYGEQATVYHKHVRDWIPRWRPWIMSPSTVYFARSCDICGSTERLIRGLGPIGLVCVDAANHPSQLRRVAYRFPDGSEVYGVEAIASCLSHVNLAWALIGWCMRLPVLRTFIQILIDGTGAVPSQRAGSNG